MLKMNKLELKNKQNNNKKRDTYYTSYKYFIL